MKLCFHPLHFWPHEQTLRKSNEMQICRISSRPVLFTSVPKPSSKRLRWLGKMENCFCPLFTTLIVGSMLFFVQTFLCFMRCYCPSIFNIYRHSQGDICQEIVWEMTPGVLYRQRIGVAKLHNVPTACWMWTTTSFQTTHHANNGIYIFVGLYWQIYLKSQWK